MGLKSIEVQGNGILKSQTIIPHPTLNIIRGANGSGKTTFLGGIVAKYEKTHSIRALLASVQHFKSFIEIELYANTSSIRPPIARQFINEYQTITQLIDNEKLSAECNKFFEKLKIPTRVDSHKGWLFFNNPKRKPARNIPLEKISPGERTAFILWLLTKSAIKPDILILDEFDAHLSFIESVPYDGENIGLEKAMYKIIIENFCNNEVQVFISTNRKLILDRQLDRVDYKQFIIENGKIEERHQD